MAERFREDGCSLITSLGTQRTSECMVNYCTHPMGVSYAPCEGDLRNWRGKATQLVRESYADEGERRTWGKATHLVRESYTTCSGELRTLWGRVMHLVRESDENGEIELSTWWGRAKHLVRVSYAPDEWELRTWWGWMSHWFPPGWRASSVFLRRCRAAAGSQWTPRWSWTD